MAYSGGSFWAWSAP